MTKPVADGICAALESAGIRCWIAPRDLIAGRAFSGEIIRGIKSCRVMVLLFSSHANASPEVLREVQLATTHRLHLVNFRIEASGVSDDLAYFLGIPHWLDAMTQPMRESHERLVESVKALLTLGPKDAPTPPSGPLPPSLARSAHKVPPWAIPAGIAAAALAAALIFWPRDTGTAGTGGTDKAPPPPAGTATGVTTGSGIIANPKTPEEHYRNARVYQLGANLSGARESYTAFLAADLDTIDPWLNFSALLKLQEGREGAIETMRALAAKSKAVSPQVALALMEEREPRIARLAALHKEHPGYGPLPYLLSQEYSDAKRGESSIAEKRSEREWLEKFRAAQAAGQVVKYFIDKQEAQKWAATAEDRWAKVNSTPAATLETPITMILLSIKGGWMANLMSADPRTKELFYRLDGQGEFRSTGFLPTTNQQSGTPVPNPSASLGKLSAGEHKLEVKYLDSNDQMNGPYTLTISTLAESVKTARQMLEASRDQWLYYSESNGKTRLWFLRVLMQRPGIQEIRYSFDNDSLDQKYDFKPSDQFIDPSELMAELGPNIFVEVPPDTKFTTAQVTFKDGTKSEIAKFDVTK